jgi:hypothetical protein|tara:strand:+ start:680 stop:925 length:246 start_codon:yes stop_codon:yes gene_type:complete
MPYKNPKDRKKQVNAPVNSKTFEARMERQRARRAVDKKGVDRTGKDVSHNKPLRKGGTNKDGYRLESPSKNRSRNGKKPAK